MTVKPNTELLVRQINFAALLGVNLETVLDLQFCDACGGEDYQWTDWSLTQLELEEGVSTDKVMKYRNYLAQTACKGCGATGFKGGKTLLTQI